MSIEDITMGQYQRGMSALSWVVVIGAAVFVGMCAFRIIPVYMDNWYVTEVLESIAQEGDLNSLDKRGIESKISRYLSINTVGTEASKSFKVKRQKDRYLVNSVYEVRVPIIANVDVMVSFKNQLDTQNKDKCCEFLIEDFDEKK